MASHLPASRNVNFPRHLQSSVKSEKLEKWIGKINETLIQVFLFTLFQFLTEKRGLST